MTSAESITFSQTHLLGCAPTSPSLPERVNFRGTVVLWLSSGGLPCCQEDGLALCIHLSASGHAACLFCVSMFPKALEILRVLWSQRLEDNISLQVCMTELGTAPETQQAWGQNPVRHLSLPHTGMENDLFSIQMSHIIPAAKKVYHALVYLEGIKKKIK